MKFSFVIPTYNKYELVHQCFYDIVQKCSLVHEVIVMDNGSTQEEIFTGLNWWKGTGLLPLRVIRTEENLGFLRASNLGMKKATGDIVCLLSNDVRLYGDIVHRIQHILKADNMTLVGGRLLDWNTGWNVFGNRMFPYIEGWLLAATKEMWEQVGYFDERYAPNDFEDVDLSTSFIHVGGRLEALPEDITHHMGAQSIGYSPEREKITKINQKKFKEKWVK